MARMSIVDMMSQNPYKIRNKDKLYKTVYQLTNIANKRIEQVNKMGYNIIRNQSKYYINPRSGKFDSVKKDDSVEKMQRKYSQLQAFINSPGNDIKKIKREQRRLKNKFKNEKLTEADYQMYRKQAGKIWAKMDENEKINGLGSERMETIIIQNMKSFSSFKARLRHIEEDIKSENKAEQLKNDLFEKQMAALNNQ